MRDVGEFSVAEIAEEARGAVVGGADEEEVGLAVVVEVEEAGAGGGGEFCGGVSERLWREIYFDRSGGGGDRAFGEFGERVAALIAVAGAERSAEMIGGDFLKAGEMFTRGGGVTFALVGASDAEFGGGVERESFERFLEGGDGFVVVLRLGLQVADEIVAVGFGRELRDVGEGGDSLFDFAGIFVDEAEVVPGVGIVGEFFRGLFESGAGGVEFLLAEERDAEIYAGDGEFWIGGEGLLEIFLGVGKFLLVHVGDAEGVEAEGVGGVGGRGGVGGWRLGGVARGVRCFCAQAGGTDDDEEDGDCEEIQSRA